MKQRTFVIVAIMAFLLAGCGSSETTIEDAYENVIEEAEENVELTGELDISAEELLVGDETETEETVVEVTYSQKELMDMIDPDVHISYVETIGYTGAEMSYTPADYILDDTMIEALQYILDGIAEETYDTYYGKISIFESAVSNMAYYYHQGYITKDDYYNSVFDLTYWNIINEGIANGTYVEGTYQDVTDAVETVPEETQVTAEQETSTVVTIDTFSFTDLNTIMYINGTVNVRDLPSTDGNVIGTVSGTNGEVTVTGQCNETGWYRVQITWDDTGETQTGYMSNTLLSSEMTEYTVSSEESTYDPIAEAKAMLEIKKMMGMDLEVIVFYEEDGLYHWAQQTYATYDEACAAIRENLGSEAVPTLMDISVRREIPEGVTIH